MMRLAISVFLTISAINATAQPYFELREQWGVSFYRAFVTGDDYAFAAGEGLDVLDIRDPQNPTWRKTHITPYVDDLLLHEERLFVVSGKTVLIYDVTNPMALRKRDEIDLSRFSQGTDFDLEMVATSQRLYCRIDVTAYVFDIQSYPVLLGSIDLTQASGRSPSIAVRDNHLFAFGTTLLAIDATNPQEPQIHSVPPQPGLFLPTLENDLVIQDNLAYALGLRGLELFDLKEPSRPEFIGGELISGEQIIFHGSRIVIIRAFSADIYDVAPGLDGPDIYQTDSLSDVRKIVPVNNYLYHFRSEGVDIYQSFGFPQPDSNFYQEGGVFNYQDINGQSLFNTAGGLVRLFNTADGFTEVSRWDAFHITQFAYDRGRVSAADGGRLLFLDAADVSAPTLIKDFAPWEDLDFPLGTYKVTNIIPGDDHWFVQYDMVSGQYLAVFAMSGPDATPNALLNLEIDERHDQGFMVRDGNRLVLAGQTSDGATRSYVTVIDITDPAKPRTLQKLQDLPLHIRGLSAADGRIAIGHDQGLRIYDAETLEIRTSRSDFQTYGVLLKDGRLYASTTELDNPRRLNGALRVFDLFDVGAPRERLRYEGPARLIGTQIQRIRDQLVLSGGDTLFLYDTIIQLGPMLQSWRKPFLMTDLVTFVNSTAQNTAK